MKSNFQLNIDAVYVLSVKKFKDRIQHIQKQAERLGIEFEFIFQHDADEINPDIDHYYFGENPTLAKPQRSLVLKHIESWKCCKEKATREFWCLKTMLFFKMTLSIKSMTYVQS